MKLFKREAKDMQNTRETVTPGNSPKAQELRAEYGELIEKSARLSNWSAEIQKERDALYAGALDDPIAAAKRLATLDAEIEAAHRMRAFVADKVQRKLAELQRRVAFEESKAGRVALARDFDLN